MTAHRFALALVLFAGCAPQRGEAYVHAFAAGERAYHAGRYEEAARSYDDAAAKALRVKDRDEARFLQARVLLRAGDVGAARAALERLVAESPKGPRTVTARFELAKLDAEHGDAEAAWRRLLDLARENPTHGYARMTLLRIVRREGERGGDAAIVAWARGAIEGFRGTDLEEVLGYEIASAIERGGDLPAAREAFVENARKFPYPYGGLADDAWWHASAIDEKLGRHQQAVADLREMLERREVSRNMGSYERPRFSPAQFRIAELYRDRLHDEAAARREFHKLVTDHPTSILRDDALFAEARLARKAGDDAEACSLAHALVRDFAESRFARCAREVCPSAPPPPDGNECAAYIVRDKDGGDDGEDATERGAP